MSDLKIDTATGDLDLSTNDAILLSDGDDIRQHLRIRLRTFRGSWFLDLNVGIPFYDNILVKNPSINVVRSILRQAILTTPGITGIDTFSFDYDGDTRTLNIELVARITSSDEPLVFTEELVIT